MAEPELNHIDLDSKGNLTIDHTNIKELIVKYYKIDAEILFSRAPFLKDNAEEFSYVKPFLSTTLQVREKDCIDEVMHTIMQTKVELPANLKNKNLVIEIVAEGKQEFKTFYSTELSIVFNEAFGELKVMLESDDGKKKGLGKVYVKVFSQMNNGKEEFFRDGYTDIRGKFEYAMASGESLNNIKKFAVLVLSD